MCINLVGVQRVSDTGEEDLKPWRSSSPTEDKASVWTEPRGECHTQMPSDDISEH